MCIMLPCGSFSNISIIIKLGLICRYMIGIRTKSRVLFSYFTWIEFEGFQSRPICLPRSRRWELEGNKIEPLNFSASSSVQYSLVLCCCSNSSFRQPLLCLVCYCFQIHKTWRGGIRSFCPFPMLSDDVSKCRFNFNHFPRPVQCWHATQLLLINHRQRHTITNHDTLRNRSLRIIYFYQALHFKSPLLLLTFSWTGPTINLVKE